VQALQIAVLVQLVRVRLVLWPMAGVRLVLARRASVLERVPVQELRQTAEVQKQERQEVHQTRQGLRLQQVDPLAR
jgi:hypothetical protein